jgi:hypothetical protein
MASFVRTISREKFNPDLTVEFSCYLFEIKIHYFYVLSFLS